MNRRLAALALVWAAGTAACAQVTVGLNLSQDQFLPGEPIPVSVRITNFSGQMLPLGRDNHWLQFTIESTSGYPIPRLNDVPVQEPFDLENASIATKRLEVGSHFEPLKPGRYLMQALVRIEAWGQTLASSPREFDVIAGTVLWEQDFGLPRPSGSTQPPEIRRYVLQQAIHLKQMKLYVRVTDVTGGKLYNVFPVGPMLTFSNPEKQIDRESQLHLLYQVGARTFLYALITPDGKLIGRQLHDYAGASRPVLKVDAEGQVVVRGGQRRPDRNDLPPPAPGPVSESPVAESDTPAPLAP